MDPTQPDDEDLEEFEREFSMEEDHPLQSLGSWVIVLGCVVAIIFWVVTLLEVILRRT